MDRADISSSDLQSKTVVGRSTRSSLKLPNYYALPQATTVTDTTTYYYDSSLYT